MGNNSAVSTRRMLIGSGDPGEWRFDEAAPLRIRERSVREEARNDQEAYQQRYAGWGQKWFYQPGDVVYVKSHPLSNKDKHLNQGFMHNQEDDERSSFASNRQNNMASSQHGSAAEESEEDDATITLPGATHYVNSSRLFTERCDCTCLGVGVRKNKELYIVTTVKI